MNHTEWSIPFVHLEIDDDMVHRLVYMNHTVWLYIHSDNQIH